MVDLLFPFNRIHSCRSLEGCICKDGPVVVALEVNSFVVRTYGHYGDFLMAFLRSEEQTVACLVQSDIGAIGISNQEFVCINPDS